MVLDLHPANDDRIRVLSGCPANSGPVNFGRKGPSVYILKPVCFVVISAFRFCYAPKRLQLSEERSVLVDSVIKIRYFSGSRCLETRTYCSISTRPQDLGTSEVLCTEISLRLDKNWINRKKSKIPRGGSSNLCH